MIRQSGFVVFVLSCFFLSACVTDRSLQKNTEAPVSQQTPVNEAQHRAKVHTELGVLYLQQDRFAVALDEARVALESDSSYAPAYVLLANTYATLNDAKLAEENFKQALSLAPNDPEINTDYGNFLCQNNQEKIAIEYFQKALRNLLYQTPTVPNTSAGICSIRLKDDKAAETYLMRALQLDGANTRASYWLADVYYRTGRLHEAHQLMVDLNKMTEPGAEALWLSLRIDRKLGERESEAKLASQLRRRFNTSPQYQLYLQGRFE